MMLLGLNSILWRREGVEWEWEWEGLMERMKRYVGFIINVAFATLPLNLNAHSISLINTNF